MITTAAKTHLIRVRAAVKKYLSITVKEKLDYQARYGQKLTSGRYANGLGISVNTFNDAVRKAKSEIRGDTPQTTGTGRQQLFTEQEENMLSTYIELRTVYGDPMAQCEFLECASGLLRAVKPELK